MTVPTSHTSPEHLINKKQERIFTNWRKTYSKFSFPCPKSRNAFPRGYCIGAHYTVNGILTSFSSLLVYITYFSTPSFLISLHFYSQCTENTLNAITLTLEFLFCISRFGYMSVSETESWHSNYSHNQGILPYFFK